MFLIVDNTKRKFRDTIREELLSRGIPAFLTNLEKCGDYMPCSAVFVCEEYLLEDAAQIAKIYNIPRKNVLFTPQKVIIERAENMYEGFLEENWSHIRERRIKFIGGEVCFCGKTLKLTKTERLIVQMLLCTNGFVDSRRLAYYCVKNLKESCVPVHICNINAKTKDLTGQNLIIKRRFSGYMI